MPNSNCSLFSTNKGSLLDVLREDFPRPFSWESVWLAAVSLLLVIGLDSPAALTGHARTFIGHSKRQIVRRPMMVRLIAGVQNSPRAHAKLLLHGIDKYTLSHLIFVLFHYLFKSILRGMKECEI